MASSDADIPCQVASESAPPLQAGLGQAGLGGIPHRLKALGTSDQVAFRDLLLGLDGPSRFSRFSCALSDDGIVGHAQYAASEAACIVGAFAGDELCGAVELYETRRSLFPVDAQAVIYKPARSTMMSAPKRKEEWGLQFERRTPLRFEPLMGWTEDDDPLAQVELSFRSSETAIAYARRQGLQYIVVGSPSDDPQGRPVANKDAVVRQQTSDTDPRRRKLEWLERALQPNLMVSSSSTGARTNQLRPAAPIKAGGRGGEPQLVAAS